MSASPVLSADLVRDLDRQPGPEAWNRIRQTLLDLFSRDLPEDAVAESRKRDGLVAPLDLYLSTSAWDLWSGFGEWVPRTSHALKQWWQANGSGKAILILDGFSLRELSWFVTHAAGHRLRVKGIQVLGAEFPADTVPFAKALGFPQRSALQNNGGQGNPIFPGCFTETTEAPFLDCIPMVGAQPNLIFWHHWPDVSLHECNDQGSGLRFHLTDVAGKMVGPEFWEFLLALCQGRNLVVTSDHGYAATGNFTDVSDSEQITYLKTHFHAQRNGRIDSTDPHPWSPPLALALDPTSPAILGVLGRRKWTVPGGYPTLSHGGISLLEMLVPFIELESV